MQDVDALFFGVGLDLIEERHAVVGAFLIARPSMRVAGECDDVWYAVGSGLFEPLEVEASTLSWFALLFRPLAMRITRRAAATWSG